MKHLVLLTVATFAFTPLAPVAMAMDDDFGALFTDNAPAGLRDTSPVGDVVGKDLFDPEEIKNFDPNLIEPAAGDEDVPEVENIEAQEEIGTDVDVDPAPIEISL